MNHQINAIPFQFWTLVPVLLAAPAQLAFILLYSIPRFGAGQWWRDFVGRALFLKSAVLAYVFSATALTTWSIWRRGGFSGLSFNINSYRSDYSWLLVIGYWLICIAVYYQLAALVRERHAARKRRNQGL